MERHKTNYLFMKQIKLFSMMLLLATMFVGFNACSDDDDDKGNDSIVGKWKVMQSGYDGDFMNFTSDGKFEYYHASRDYSEYGKYKVETGNLYLMYSDEDTWIIYKIVQVNSTSAIIREYEENGELGDTYSFQRMN